MNTKDDTEQLSRVEHDSHFWRQVFEWFVHDIQHQFSMLSLMEHDLEQELMASGRVQGRLWTDFIGGPLKRSLSLISIARTLTSPIEREYYKTESCTIPGVLQEIVRSRSFSWLHSDPLFTFDEELLTARPIRAAVETLREMLSHLVLFCAAISVPNKPIQASLDLPGGETLLCVHIREPGLTERDMEDIWIPPEHLLAGRMPRYELPVTARAHGFHVSFAVPAALILARRVPCTVTGSLDAEPSLLLSVRIKAKDGGAE